MIRAQIEAVVSRILGNQIDFLHAIGDECLHFLDDVRLCAAAVRAAHPGNDAEAARMVAALGDFQVGKMFRREPETRRLEIRNEDRTGGHFQQRRGWRMENRGWLAWRDNRLSLAEFIRATQGVFFF